MIRCETVSFVNAFGQLHRILSHKSLSRRCLRLDWSLEQLCFFLSISCQLSFCEHNYVNVNTGEGRGAISLSTVQKDVTHPVYRNSHRPTGRPVTQAASAFWILKRRRYRQRSGDRLSLGAQLQSVGRTLDWIDTVNHICAFLSAGVCPPVSVSVGLVGSSAAASVASSFHRSRYASCCCCSVDKLRYSSFYCYCFLTT